MKAIGMLYVCLQLQSSSGFISRRVMPVLPPLRHKQCTTKMATEQIDTYDPGNKGGCIQNLDNHIRLLSESLKKSSGTDMFQWINGESDEMSVTSASQVDSNTRFGVLSHGTQPDPIYNYGNRASLELFEYSLEELCRTPSRFSTVPELMGDRSKLIEEIESKGFGYIDDAIRVSAKGKLFLISKILVWTVFDDDNHRIGLAAIYDRNSVKPYEPTVP
eukprot:scaffold2315_cov113-Cylindrotheca_fusiformis.AAC.22